VKGGIHAYDSLATWNYTQTTADRNQDLNAADVVNTPTSSWPMMSDPTAATHELAAANRVWTMFGGTLTASSAITHDCTTLTTQCATDDYATVTVTYSVPAGTSTRNVQLLFGGHLAVSVGPLGWGAGLGSTSVNGGPYHIKWDLADGASIGNRDNQIMAGANNPPPPPTITSSTASRCSPGKALSRCRHGMPPSCMTRRRAFRALSENRSRSSSRRCAAPVDGPCSLKGSH